MSRFSGKTYSRVRTRDNYSEKIFDDLFNDEEEKTGKPTATRAVGAHQKWGNISVTSVRGPPKSDHSESKRRKVDSGPGDPFSFDAFSDEESPSGPKKKSTIKSTRGGGQVKSLQNNKKLLTFDSADTNENLTKSKNSRYNLTKANRTVTGVTTGKDVKLPVPEVRSGASNSRVTSSVISQSKTIPVSKAFDAKPATLSSTTATVLKNVPSKVQVPVNKSEEKGKQLSMDIFTKKVSDSAPKKLEPSAVNKVFPSPRDSRDNADIFSQGSRTSSLSPSSTATSVSSSPAKTSKPLAVPTSPDHTYFKSGKSKNSDSGPVNSCTSDEDIQLDFDFSEDSSGSWRQSPKKRVESQNPIQRDHAYTSPIKFKEIKENRSHPPVSSTASPIPGTSSANFSLTISDSDSDAASVKSLPTELEDKGLPKTIEEIPSRLKKTSSTYGGVKARKIFNSPKKTDSKLKRYNPRQWINNAASTEPSQEASGNQNPGSASNSQQSSKTSLLGFDDFDEKPDELPTLRRSVTWPKKQGDQPVSTLRVNKEHKKLFTVVRNVKEAHECQEHGETQEFFDDIEYLLAGLRDTQTVTTRCLSTLSLANKCIEAAFRMHLRAHGTVTKIFSALHDACCNPSLALSTSAIMYMMSRDRLNMDVDKETLELMIKLLSMDLQNEGKKKVTTQRHEAVNKEFERMKQKVRAVIAQLKKDGGAKDIDLNEVTTGNLATETLLSLTSRRTGDWFKEEVRGLGGLDHIVDTVSGCTDVLDEDAKDVSEESIPVLKKIDRCLRVLEHVTYLNSDNQSYLVSYNSSALINSICSLLKMLERFLGVCPFTDGDETDPKKNVAGRTVFNCMLSILKVLLNITHDHEWGSSKVGQHEGLLSSALMCALHCPQFAPADERFDLLVLSLGMMINLVEHSDINRRLLVNLETVSYYDTPENGKKSNSVEALDALIQLFLQKESAAGQLEESVSAPNSQGSQEKEAEQGKEKAGNESGEWEESDSGLLWVIGKKKSQDGEESDEEHIEIIPSSQEDEENFTKALHKAGKHMEDSIVAAYVALLIGCVVQENGALVTRVKDQLPDGSFEPMINVLTKFLGFMNLTNAVGNTGGKSIIKVIETLMNS